MTNKDGRRKIFLDDFQIQKKKRFKSTIYTPRHFSNSARRRHFSRDCATRPKNAFSGTRARFSLRIVFKMKFHEFFVSVRRVTGNSSGKKNRQTQYKRINTRVMLTYQSDKSERNNNTAFLVRRVINFTTAPFRFSRNTNYPITPFVRDTTVYQLLPAGPILKTVRYCTRRGCTRDGGWVGSVRPDLLFSVL